MAGASTSTFRTSDGVTLAYTDTRPSSWSGRTVVLVAGYAMPSTGWALQADSLTAAGNRVVGQSMGASATLVMIDLFGTERVAGIVTVDQAPMLVNTVEWPHGFSGMTPENSGRFFDDGIPDTGRSARVDPARPGVQRLVARIGGPPAVRQANAPETRALLRDHGLQDWRDVVASLDVPFLMVAGRESQLWPCSHAAAAVGSNPNGRVLVVEDAGHATNLDQPDVFDAALLEFTGSL